MFLTPFTWNSPLLLLLLLLLLRPLLLLLLLLLLLVSKYSRLSSIRA
jgi:hypothetical protein